MPTLSLLCRSSVLVLLAVSSASQAQDLHLKKNISAGGYVVSTTETSIKGARERSVTQSPNGSTVTLRQCDLRRTVTMDEANQTYFVADDPQDENAAKAASLATGSVLPDANGGNITVTTTITDTGERKVIYGYQARHLKAKVVQEPSPEACTQVRQSFEIDGWFADLAKEQASCAAIAPPVQPGTGCHDKVIARLVGSGKPGYPMQEDIAMPTPDGGTTTVSLRVSEITKQQLPAEMFDVPAGYRQVASFAELNNGSIAQGLIAQAPSNGPKPQMPQGKAGNQAMAPSPAMNPQAMLATQQQQMALAQAQMAAAGAFNKGGMSNANMMGGGPSARTAR